MLHGIADGKFYGFWRRYQGYWKSFRYLRTKKICRKNVDDRDGRRQTGVADRVTELQGTD